MREMRAGLRDVQREPLELDKRMKGMERDIDRLTKKWIDEWTQANLARMGLPTGS